MNHLSPQTSVTGVPPSKRRCYSSSSVDSPRELGQMRSHRETGSGSANFVGSGSGVHFVRTVRRAFASNNAKYAAPDRSNDEELVPGEDDRLDPPSSLWRYEELRSEANSSGSGNYSFDDLVLWSKSYFDSWHPPFPFLHAPTILGSLEKLSTCGIEALDQAERIILRSVMSISLADRRQLPESEGCIIPGLLVFHTTDEAILALQPLIVRPSSLPNLQAVVSVQLFLISMLRLNAASRIGGLVVRMALHLGLHRCPARFEQFSATEVDIRRRLFWSIYSFDRYLSQSLGLPLDLKDDDLDVCYHGHENHRSIATPNPASHLLLPTFLAKHGRIKGLILELRNKSILHSNFDPDEQARIDAEISRWWNEAQDLVDPIESDLNNIELDQHDHISPPFRIKSSHKLLLLVQKHESVILLNRPVITSGYETSAFAAAMQKCIGASKAIVTAVYRHVATATEQPGVPGGRIIAPLVWPGFVWLIWQSGLILLYAASEGHYSAEIAQREAMRCIAILEHLALRGTFWPSSCAAVIRELQAALVAKASRNSSIKQKPMTSDAAPNSSNHAADSPGLNIHPQDHTINNNHTRIGRTDSRPAPGRHDQHYESPQDALREEMVAFDGNQHYGNGRYANLNSSTSSRDLSGTDDVMPNVIPGLAFQSYVDDNPAVTPLSAGLGGFGGWDSMYGGSGALGGSGDQPFDIFQLMDPSYLLSGQITPAQPSGSYQIFGNMPADGSGNYHSQ